MKNIFEYYTNLGFLFNFESVISVSLWVGRIRININICIFKVIKLIISDPHTCNHLFHSSVFNFK